MALFNEKQIMKEFVGGPILTTIQIGAMGFGIATFAYLSGVHTEFAHLQKELKGTEVFMGKLASVGFVGYSAYKLFLDKGRASLKRVIAATFVDAGICLNLDEKKVYPKIKSMEITHYGFIVKIMLPNGYTVSKFEKNLEAIEQATSSKIRFRHIRGRLVQLDMGMELMQDYMAYRDSLLNKQQAAFAKSLAVPVYTPWGTYYINFWDEATTHIIVAGATRMGKSVFLRLLFTHLTLLTDGNIKFIYINNKVEDYAPLAGIPQIPPPAETEDEAMERFEQVIKEINRRKKIVRRARCVNMKQYRERFPDTNEPPLFVVIDEYGRFAESDDIQDQVRDIAETAGYLDVHLVIATQRPDAQSVLKPRIRANILARVAFQTADEMNSKIIVHVPDAAHLGSIKGRAIVLDGMPMLAQIPYMSEAQAEYLLSDFKTEGDDHDGSRQSDSDETQTVPHFVQKAARENGVH